MLLLLLVPALPLGALIGGLAVVVVVAVVARQLLLVRVRWGPRCRAPGCCSVVAAWRRRLWRMPLQLRLGLCV